MQSIINSESLRFSVSVRIMSLGLSNVLIKTLYVKILHLLPFTFLETVFFNNFVNYKINLALSNAVKMKKFKCIYIDIYLIEICQVR